MTLKSFARMIAALFIICALSFGLYMNFSEIGPNALSSRAVMVCVYK